MRSPRGSTRSWRGAGCRRMQAAPEREGALGFEEKLSPSMKGFDALCRAQLTPEERALIGDWTVLVPVSLDAEIRLPIGLRIRGRDGDRGERPRCSPSPNGLRRHWSCPPRYRRRPRTWRSPSGSWKERRRNWPLPAPAAGARTWTRPSTWPCTCRAAQHSLRLGCPITYS
ncbi:hypothetical protein ACRAWF_39430 [Streptomyces sp. L7]